MPGASVFGWPIKVALSLTGFATAALAITGVLIWALTIAASPGLAGAAGLAYPLRRRLLGHGVGAIRLGESSTGTARERVTEWVPRQPA